MDPAPGPTADDPSQVHSSTCDSGPNHPGPCHPTADVDPATDELLADYETAWLEAVGPKPPGPARLWGLLHAFAAALRAARTERDALFTVAETMTTNAEQFLAERDAAHAVICRYENGWRPHIRRGSCEWVRGRPYSFTDSDGFVEHRSDIEVEPMTPAEADAVAQATRNDKP